MIEHIQSSVTALFDKKNIVILGIGITGLSCARFLNRYDIHFSVNDSRSTVISPGNFKAQCGDNTLFLGAWNEELISSADVLIVSPGIDLNETGIVKFIKPQCQVLGDIEIFCQLFNAPIIAVTGSNGKSTVVSLLEHVGRSLGYQILLGGNVGLPVLDQVEKLTSDFAVLELSSFQLETIKSMKARVATVLNISDDHLDRHKTLKNYQSIKHSIYRQCQFALFNRTDTLTKPDIETGYKVKGSFGIDQPTQNNWGLITDQEQQYLALGNEKLISLTALPLQGIHNALNYLAVLSIGYNLDWSLSAMLLALKDFKGLAHRCEVIDSRDGIRWINDSKATNVGATLAAIKGLSPTLLNKRLILIAGGDGKGADFTSLQTVVREQVDFLITLGKDGKAISNLLRQEQRHKTIHVKNLPEAVSLAKAKATEGDMVLLSPACASLDMFSNYVERGVVFINAILSDQEAV